MSARMRSGFGVRVTAAWQHRSHGHCCLDSSPRQRLAPPTQAFPPEAFGSRSSMPAANGATTAPAESCDGQPLSALAKKAPRPKPTGAKDLDMRLTFEHSCMVRIIDRMCKDPSVIMPIHSFMINTNMEQLSSAREVGASEWTGNYRQLERVPRAWMSEFLLKRAKDTGCDQTFTPALAKNICNESAQHIDMLFYFVTQTVPSMMFPKGLQDPRLASTVFSRRAAQCGDRLKNLCLNGGFAKEGSVDFKKGAFELQFQNDLLKQVTHVATGLHAHSFGDHIRISTRFELVDNHLDHAARVILRPTVFHLYELFPESAPFRRNMYGKKFKALNELVEKVTAEFDEEAKLKQDSTVEASDRVVVKAQKRGVRPTSRRRGSSWRTAKSRTTS